MPRQNNNVFLGYVQSLKSIKNVKAKLTKDKDGETWHFSSSSLNSLDVELQYSFPAVTGLAPKDTIFLNIEGVDSGFWHTEETDLDFHIKLAEAALKGDVAHNTSRIFNFEEICFKVEGTWECTRTGNPKFGYIKRRRKIKSKKRISKGATQDHPPSLIKMNDSDYEWTYKKLRRAGYEPNEKSLLECIKNNQSNNLVYYATLSLRKVGTKKSISNLKKLTEYPKADVKICSVLAIGAIFGAEETPYYGELLDSNFKDKFYVMAVIWEVGDERAYKAVIRLAEKVVSKKVKLNEQSDALYIIEYLERYPDKDESLNLSSKLRTLSL